MDAWAMCLESVGKGSTPVGACVHGGATLWSVVVNWTADPLNKRVGRELECSGAAVGRRRQGAERQPIKPRGAKAIWAICWDEGSLAAGTTPECSFP
jgi:hypothetical protein